MRGTLVKHTRAFMKNEGRRKRGVYLIPNLLTTGNLFSGLFSILAVFNANYMNAAIAILVAVVFDMLDGKSARWTNSTSQFGVEYDSLADLVSFGVAPGLLIYSWALSGYGMLPSASIGSRVGLFEPIHGSAPDIAGKNIANPIATVASIAMMLGYSFQLEKEAAAIEEAIARTLEQGYRTKDIQSAGCTAVGTVEMGDAILKNLSQV